MRGLVFESERLTFRGFSESANWRQARENSAVHENAGTIFLSITKVNLFPESYETIYQVALSSRCVWWIIRDAHPD